MNNLDVRTKIALAVLLFTFVLLAPGAYHLLALSLLIMGLGCFSGMSVREYVKPCFYLAPFFAVILVARTFFPAFAGTPNGGETLTVDRLTRSALFIWKWIALMLVSTTLFKFITLNEFVFFLQKILHPLRKMHFPTGMMVTTIVLTIDFLGHFRNEMTRLRIPHNVVSSMKKGSLRSRMTMTGEVLSSFFEDLLRYSEEVGVRATESVSVTQVSGGFTRRDLAACVLGLLGLVLFGYTSHIC